MQLQLISFRMEAQKKSGSRSRLICFLYFRREGVRRCSKVSGAVICCASCILCVFVKCFFSASFSPAFNGHYASQCMRVSFIRYVKNFLPYSVKNRCPYRSGLFPDRSFQSGSHGSSGPLIFSFSDFRKRRRNHVLPKDSLPPFP